MVSGARSESVGTVGIKNIISNSHYVPESFLRSRQLRSYSKISQYFPEPKFSLQWIREPSSGPDPEPDEFSQYYPILFL
jgi:hypothetical protein